MQFSFEVQTDILFGQRVALNSCGRGYPFSEIEQIEALRNMV